MTDHCNTCKFHEPAGSGGRNSKGEEVPVGTCMRFPPIFANGSFQPSIVGSHTTWCGEHVKKPAAPARKKGPAK